MSSRLPSAGGRGFWKYWNTILCLSVSVGLFSVLLFCLTTSVPFAVFCRDPIALAHGKPYFGFLSSIGILFWCGAVAICFFVWAITQTAISTIAEENFLLFSACLTLLLLLDDLFMLHEYIFPKILGVRQRYVLLTYIMLTLAYVVWFRKVILRQHTSILVAAFVFFIISLVADRFMPHSDTWQYFVEDGAKFMGIVCWFNYFFHVCKEEISVALGSKMSG